jgi:4'-phosphopantetheinyl transferase
VLASIRIHQACGEDLIDLPHEWLSPHERGRASRFVFEKDRRRYIAGRLFLRSVLAEHLDTAPGAITFGYSPDGKPHIADIHFNLSRSEDVVVVAVADLPIGVDIERIAGGSSRLAGRVLTSRELEQWRALPLSERDAAFTRAWVRKEACVKALGTGMNDDVASMEVGVGLLDDGGQVICNDTSMATWDLDTVPGHLAAVAAVVPEGGRVRQPSDRREVEGGRLRLQSGMAAPTG